MSRRRTRIHTRLLGLSTPVFVVDAQRRMLFFNEGCEELTGWAAEDVVGRQCEYVSEPDATTSRSVIVGLCPPPSVLAGDEAHVPVFLQHRERGSMARMVRYFPLMTDEGTVDCVLGLIGDIPAPRPTAGNVAHSLHAELSSLRARLRVEFAADTFLAKEATHRRALQQATAAQACALPVWFIGEAGTGREHLARLIHYGSGEKSLTFVPLDCQSLSPLDLKLTLRRIFRGDAASASVPSLPGLMPGTVYLNHAEAITRDIQEFLVETLADGDSMPVRVMAASTDTPQSLCEQEQLRDDFFFAMTPLQISLPALRESPGQLDLLAQHFLEETNRSRESQFEGFSPEVWSQFREYRWPGNLDELHAVVHEAITVSAGPVVSVADLPFRFRTGRDAQTVGPPKRRVTMPLKDHLDAVEREHIELALLEAGDNKTRAAELLGLTRAALYRRMEALKIGPEPPDNARTSAVDS